MKVLQVVPSLALRHGGVSVSVRELCLGLAGLGVEVDLWSTRRAYDPDVDGPEDRKLKEAGVRLRYLALQGWNPLGERYAYSPSLAPALRECVPHVDLVHIHALWLYPTLATAQACRRFRVPYVLSPCGALDPYSLRIRLVWKTLYGRLIERNNLRTAAGVHFTSDMEQRQAWTFGVACRGAVVPRCVNLRDAAAAEPGAFRGEHPETGSRKILLFLGRLHPKKRLDLAVRAFVLLCRRREDVHLAVAGPDEGSVPEARRILEEAGLSGRATFTGLLAGKRKWEAVRDASLFLFPSEDENFGITALEALALGVPVLLSPGVGVSPEIAAAGAGLTLPPDPAAWSDSMELLLRQPERAAAMGQVGRRLVDTKFSVPRVAARMKELYETLLRTGR